MKKSLRSPLPKDSFFKFKLKHHINYFLVLGFFLIFLVLEFALPRGLKQSSRDMLTQMAYNIILAVSLNIVVGLLGELSLGHAGFMCIGAYIGGLIGNILWPLMPPSLALILAMIAGGAAAAVAGLLIGIPTLRLKGDYLAITTLAFGEIVRNVFKNLPWFGKALGLSTQYYGRKLYIPAFIALFLIVILCQNLEKSRHGRAIQAIRDSEISARAMGVNVTYHKLAAFVIAAFFAGIAGVIYAHNVSPVRDSFFKFDKSIEILVMVVLGGMGNLTGSIIAAGALTFINLKLDVYLSGDLASLKKIIYAFILIALVIWNNAPALRGLREKYSLQRLWLKMRDRMPHDKRAESEPPTTANWDKIPTKIAMDTILSTDFTPNDEKTADDDRKPEAK